MVGDLPTRVKVILSDGSSEEPFASVTRSRAVVLASGAIPADRTMLGEHSGHPRAGDSQNGTARPSGAHAQVRI